MLPETPLELSERSLALWKDLALAYDDIERALRDPESGPLAALAAHIVALETELRPLVARLAALRTREPPEDAALAELWSETDRVVEGLAQRQPVLVRAALAARDETASRLARVRSERQQRALYGGRAGPEPRFTSQRA